MDDSTPPKPEPKKNRPHYVGHRGRLRQRFMGAPENMPDYELLEAFLTYVLPRKDVKPLAKELIASFGNLSEVLCADPNALTAFPGLGAHSTAALKIAREMANRLALAQIQHRPLLASISVVVDFCTTHFARLPVEQFHVLFLDLQTRLIRAETLQQGTIDRTPLYPREVVKRALELGASGLFLVHNHPSGDPTPSQADISATRAVKEALSRVAVTLHDHIIIGRSGYTSLKTAQIAF